MAFHNDPQVAFASAVGFVSIGKVLEWLGHFISTNADLFAGCSYILASVAAAMTIYYTWRKNRPPKG